MTKEELRALYRQVRLRMSPAEVSTKSRIIGRQLLNDVDWTNFKNVCVFEPIPRLNEVNIKPVIPRIIAQDIEVILLTNSQASKPPPTKFMLIIVPCLAFDEGLHRLGWGGGWYDRFLAAQPQAYKIGLSFHNGFVEAGLPYDRYDIKMDIIITEKMVLREGFEPPTFWSEARRSNPLS